MYFVTIRLKINEYAIGWTCYDHVIYLLVFLMMGRQLLSLK